MMDNAVKRFLALHHSVSLPDVGTIKIETLPAHINIAERTITPETYKILFFSGETQPENNFYHFLSEELSVDETQAAQSLAQFTNNFKTNLLHNKEVDIKGIGRFTKTSAEALDFFAEDVAFYLPELKAEKIIRKNATHTVRVGEQEKASTDVETLVPQPAVVHKENWWIAAVVLAITGVAMIAYYYLVLHPAQ